jgi:hypothetical protein
LTNRVRTVINRPAMSMLLAILVVLAITALGLLACAVVAFGLSGKNDEPK